MLKPPHDGALWACLSFVCGLLLLASSDAFGQDTFFVRDGARLFYRQEGSGPPVILLSGGPGMDVDYLVPAARALPSNVTRIFFEQRGTGRSRSALTPATMTLDGAVADLEALRVHLRQDRLLLVGHSWGGMLALAYAAAHPDRIDRLILIGSGGPTLEFTQWFDDNIVARLRPEDIAAADAAQASAVKGVDPNTAMLQHLRAITPGYFFNRAKAVAFAPTITLNAEVSSLLFADLAKRYDVREGLTRLKRPVLIVHGHQDPIGDKTAEDLHRLLTESTLVYIDKAGHYPWIEQPEAFTKAIGGFLEKTANR